MIIDPSETVTGRGAKLLGALWLKAIEHMQATLTAVLDGNAQCDLVIVDDPGAICRLSNAPNQITVSTGQIVRVAVISHVIAQKFSKSEKLKDGALGSQQLNELRPEELREPNIHIVDPHWFDDMDSETHRENIVKRRPPPGMAPAFCDVPEPDDLWNWADQQLTPSPTGSAADYYELISLFALAFLVAHEAAHLIFDHIDLQKRILKEDGGYRECDQKCVEIHADLEVIKAFILGVFREDARLDEEAYFALVFERLGLTGAAILVSLSFGDHTMRGLRTYDDPVSDALFLARKYPHPSVRFALMEIFLIRCLNEIAPNLGDSARPSFRSAVATTVYALNWWFLTEAKKAGNGDWALPYPFSLVMSQEANYPMKTAEEFLTQLLPAYFARHFPGYVDMGLPMASTSPR